MATDLLRKGNDWLEQMRSTHCSSPVVYRRGDQDLALVATFGRTDYEVEDGTGLRVAGHITDFLIEADTFTPTFGTPQTGDRIVADGVLYEVMSLGGQGHWRWSDPYRTTLRIHTREIGEAQ